MSPILLGAISYQESHWNAKAISPTLVKGLMMLTKAVASEQGVTDRFNPLQSIEGGTKHFLKMMKMVPNRIIEPNKTNFALAAYNIGYGHLEKARVMTQRAGKNPDLWTDVKLFLPQLNDLDGFKADGRTAVRYVENIHVYQNLLQWKEQQF
ncbi:MAG: transglycosylase SLT domain-containing protein [Alcanivoracaceae bacterium]|nr:transglycosylase SLT domain-containing protein [Alcanivoracaceae bacterium]